MRTILRKQTLLSTNSFTLVELLIVIVIISIIASMLLPALKNAREKAKNSVCLNNLKQLGMSFFMYANDWDGWCLGDYETGPFWMELIGPYVGGEDEANAGTTPDIVWCPRSTWKKENWTTKERSNYALNIQAASHLDGSTQYAFRKLDQQPTPSETIMFLDWRGVQRKAYHNEIANMYTDPDYYKEIFRHNFFTNIIYLDGHVDSVAYGKLSEQYWIKPWVGNPFLIW